MKLSVLDMAMVDPGESAKEALLNTVSLARLAEDLGYERFWVTEHHNMDSVAAASPDMIIGQIAARTHTIRLGTGGTMLPNHSPYIVAERFKVLEAFYPGRIDLGIGRAPGTDGNTALAIRRSPQPYNANDIQALLDELQSYDHSKNSGDISKGPFGKIIAMPVDVALPPIYMLGSSLHSAQVSAANGLRYAFAHHFNPEGAHQAISIYRESYRKINGKDAPPVILAVNVMAAETEEELALHKKFIALKLLATSGNISSAVLDRWQSVELPQEYMAAAGSYLDTIVIATYGQLKQRLDELVQRLEVDEILVTTVMQGFENRKRLYEILAETYL